MSFPVNKTSKRAPASAHGKQPPKAKAPAIVEALRAPPMARQAPGRGVSAMQPQLPGAVANAPRGARPMAPMPPGDDGPAY
jgi:hypothetical protein